MTKKHARFVWFKECQEEFELLKGALCKETFLHFVDPSLNTYLFTDAHIIGISAIIAQGNDPATSKPIAFASRSTSPVERRYAQFDLEALSVDFALRRFHNYLVGGPTAKIFTDHKPLISIFANRRKGSVRTDRIKLRHQDISYDGCRVSKTQLITYPAILNLSLDCQRRGRKRHQNSIKLFGFCSIHPIHRVSVNGDDN